MESNYKNYDFTNSRDRLDEILNASNSSFEELNSIPSRSKLSYQNGFYVKCTALFVDIRESSKLPEKHKRPALAKIYRSYISELTAILNGNSNCKEINIHGDSVWGVFNTPKQADIDSVFSTAAQIASIVDILNCKLEKKNFSTIKIGIGIDYGRALMILAGYKGSGINDVVWMGDVVNQASKLCGYGNKGLSDKRIMLSNVIHHNLNQANKDLCSWNSDRNCWNCNIVNTNMNSWYQSNC